MRIRRVGSITCGTLLIVFGILFFLHLLMPQITIGFIFRFWPLILIFLGIEILCSNIKGWTEYTRYDIGAIVLMVMLLLFAMGMGIMEMFWEMAKGSM